jgi:arylsulfatase
VIGSQLDIVPTLLSLGPGTAAAVPSSAALPGVDLSAELDGAGDAPPRRAALFVYDGLTFLDGDWAYRTFAGMRVDDYVTGRDLTKRGLMRTIITDRFKFSRYFAPGDHHRPGSVEELLSRNTVELFDLENGPDEQVDLALLPSAATKALIEDLDDQLSSLIESEFGDDDGHWLPRFAGAPWMR